MAESSNSTNRPYKPTKKEEKKMSEKKKYDFDEISGSIRLSDESKNKIHDVVHEEVMQELLSGDAFNSDEVVQFMGKFTNQTLINMIKAAVENAIANTNEDELVFDSQKSNLHQLRLISLLLEM